MFFVIREAFDNVRFRNDARFFVVREAFDKMRFGDDARLRNPSSPLAKTTFSVSWCHAEVSFGVRGRVHIREFVIFLIRHVSNIWMRRNRFFIR